MILDGPIFFEDVPDCHSKAVDRKEGEKVVEGIEKLRDRVLKKCKGDPAKYNDLQQYALKLSQVQTFPFAWDLSIYEDEDFRYDGTFNEEQLAPGKSCFCIILSWIYAHMIQFFNIYIVLSYQVPLLEIWKM